MSIGNRVGLALRMTAKAITTSVADTARAIVGTTYHTAQELSLGLSGVDTSGNHTIKPAKRTTRK